MISAGGAAIEAYKYRHHLERKDIEQREREKECSRIKERGVAARREETQVLSLTNPKSCILPSFGVVVQ